MTLLSANDKCGSCGWPASDHRGWQREVERGAIPNPGIERKRARVEPLDPPVEHCEHGFVVAPEWPCSQCAAERIGQRGAGCIPECNDRYPCVVDDTCPGRAPSSPAPASSPPPVEPAPFVLQSDEVLEGLLGARTSKPADRPSLRTKPSRVVRIVARALFAIADVLDS